MTNNPLYSAALKAAADVAARHRERCSAEQGDDSRSPARREYARMEGQTAFEIGREILALPVPDLAGMVRKLEWVPLEVDRGDGTSEPSGDYEAESIVGYYQIDMGFGSDSYHWDVRLGDQFLSWFDDPETAKAAAQADYAARILTGLNMGDGK